MAQNFIVVGASSGIGRSIASSLLREGHKVVLVARRKKELESLAQAFPPGLAHPLVHDVTKTESSASIFQKALTLLGGNLDGIFYASGIMTNVGSEEFSTEKDLPMLQVNLLGAIAFLNPAADYFQKQKKGWIVGISSIAGDRGRRGAPVYNTSKAGLDTYLEALRNRLAVKGVQVVTVKPGFVSTDMLAGATVPQKGLLAPITPEKAAEIILAKIRKGKEVFYVPSQWALVGLIVRNIPSFLFRKTNI